MDENIFAGIESNYLAQFDLEDMTEEGIRARRENEEFFAEVI